jgi:hypothetical protein
MCSNVAKAKFVKNLKGDFFVIPGLVVCVLRLNPGVLVVNQQSFKGGNLLSCAEWGILAAP